jgi:hypothetical protein
MPDLLVGPGEVVRSYKINSLHWQTPKTSSVVFHCLLFKLATRDLDRCHGLIGNTHTPRIVKS